MGGGGLKFLESVFFFFFRVKISSKSEVAISIFRGPEPPIREAYNNLKKLKFWDSALFSG